MTRRAGAVALAAVLLGLPTAIGVLVAVRFLLAIVMPGDGAVGVAVLAGLGSGLAVTAIAGVTLRRQLDPPAPKAAPATPRPPAPPGPGRPGSG